MLRRASNGQGELVSGELISPAAGAALGVTSSFVASSPAGLPLRNVQRVAADDRGADQGDPRDLILASGVEISSPATQQAVEAVATDGHTGQDSGSVDEALSLVLDELNLNGDLE